ncbi:hypothetical protein [Burkholderia pyrrocinia]|uniref:hypothetical protein n=1 Tax=Burkholderia pyrrocinia TaxID=60550 RepID=UPI001404B2A2|nr:hypothetical protein [Burkholderia pyrrocinia]
MNYLQGSPRFCPHLLGGLLSLSQIHDHVLGVGLRDLAMLLARFGVVSIGAQAQTIAQKTTIKSLCTIQIIRITSR